MNDLDNEMELLNRLRAGDANAYLQLYNRYHPALYSYVLRFVKIPELAEDVLQEVFIKIWEIRERINPTLSFNAYLYRICRNSVFKLVKKIAADEDMKMQATYQIRQTADGADLQLQWQQYQQVLNNAIDLLPAQRQKVFKLCRTEGKTYAEVAGELGISRNTVKEHMVLAVKFIKDYMFLHGDIQVALMFVVLQQSGELVF